MDLLAALRLQIEWGADEALEAEPIGRLCAAPAAPSPGSLPEPRGSASQLKPADVSGGRELAADDSPATTRPLRASAPPTGAAAAERARQAAEGAATLAELNAAIAGFDGCRLRDTAAHSVLAEGDPGSGLLLVGEAPSADDDREGRPFTGAAGHYVERMLASAGLDRHTALLAPLLPWRPPGDRPPSPAELAICLPFLIRLIVLSRARLLLLCGPLAARGLLSSGGSRRIRRGKWAELQLPGGAAPVRALPTLSPELVRRDPGRRREAWADLRALRRAFDELIARK